jgi:hypothetical protein
VDPLLDLELVLVELERELGHLRSPLWHRPRATAGPPEEYP